jgi:hypothetical protein
MPSFWSLLRSKVRSEEMEFDEALRRDNYHSFVKEMPCASEVDTRRYVLDTPLEELPPYVVCMSDGQGAAYHHFIECVRDGSLTPYEAAQAYFDMVGG